MIIHSLSILIFCYKSIISHHQDHLVLKIEGHQGVIECQARPFPDNAHQVCVRPSKKILKFTAPPFPCPIHPFVHLPFKPLLDGSVWISIPPYWSYFTRHTSIEATIYSFPGPDWAFCYSHLVRIHVVSIIYVLEYSNLKSEKIYARLLSRS